MHVHPSPLPWARLHVVRGAPPSHYLFAAAHPVQLVIGSAPVAHLMLAVAGVAPRQLELAWDGNALWLQDPLRLGCTLVNGRPLNEWQLVRGEVLIAFARVRLWVAARLVAPVPPCPDFNALERAQQGAAALFGYRRTPTVRVMPEDFSEAEPDIASA